MSTDRDVTRIVRSWLEEGVTALPDRVLDAVLDQVPATRQRRAWWPARRFPAMTNTVRFALAAAAVVVVAVLGVSLLPRQEVGGLPIAAPSPTPTPRPFAVVSSISSPLEPGTYLTADPFLFRVTFTVPAGWNGNMGGPYHVALDNAHGTGGVSFLFFEKVYADPCHFGKGLLNPLPGPAVQDLATALARVPGLNATTPTDVVLGGYQGKLLTLTAPTTFAGCTLAPGGNYRVWELPLGATFDMNPGERDRVWILDVAGKRLVINAYEGPGQTAADKAEVQGILDSISIAPVN